MQFGIFGAAHDTARFFRSKNAFLFLSEYKRIGTAWEYVCNNILLITAHHLAATATLPH